MALHFKSLQSTSGPDKLIPSPSLFIGYMKWTKYSFFITQIIILHCNCIKHLKILSPIIFSSVYFWYPRKEPLLQRYINQNCVFELANSSLLLILIQSYSVNEIIFISTRLVYFKIRIVLIHWHLTKYCFFILRIFILHCTGIKPLKTLSPIIFFLRLLLVTTKTAFYYSIT